MTGALNQPESRVPTVMELEEIQDWATQAWKQGKAPSNLHMRKLVGKLLVGYAGLIEMVSSPAYQRLTGSKSIPLAEQIAQRTPRLGYEEELARLRAWRADLLTLAAEQAEDEALWAHAEYISEAYIQQELRRLTALVERMG